MFGFLAVSCPTIDKVRHGIVSTTSGRFMEKAELQCRSGYSVDGPSTIWCKADGHWSATIGRCEKKRK